MLGVLFKTVAKKVLPQLVRMGTKAAGKAAKAAKPVASNNAWSMDNLKNSRPGRPESSRSNGQRNSFANQGPATRRTDPPATESTRKPVDPPVTGSIGKPVDPPATGSIGKPVDPPATVKADNITKPAATEAGDPPGVSIFGSSNSDLMKDLATGAGAALLFDMMLF